MAAPDATASAAARLPAALAAWGAPGFARALCDELRERDLLFAPLQRAMAHGSHALIDHAVLMVLRSRDDADAIELDAGVSYSSISPGCGCQDDPTPMSELPEYAVLRIRSARAQAEASVRLIED